MRHSTLTLLACLSLLAACSKAPPAPAATPAAAADTTNDAAAREGARHHELKDAIEARDYRDKAKAAGDAALDADKAHDKQLEDSGG
jgi:uncharacterized lipoprotein YajG